jgi:hypothetical protein
MDKKGVRTHGRQEEKKEEVDEEEKEVTRQFRNSGDTTPPKSETGVVSPAFFGLASFK